MSAFKYWLQNAKHNLGEQVKKFKNKDFLDAVVAGCAVVAAADGSIDSNEKQKMTGYMSRSEELKVFDIGDVINRFNSFASNIEFDFMIGKQEAFRTISKFRSKPEVARVIIGVCCAIATADGDFDPKEKAIIEEMCSVLGLSASEFNL